MTSADAGADLTQALPPFVEPFTIVWPGLYWASSSTLPGVQHVARADAGPARCLCGWTIRTQDLAPPQGLICAGCLSVAQRVTQLTIPRSA